MGFLLYLGLKYCLLNSPLRNRRKMEVYDLWGTTMSKDLWKLEMQYFCLWFSFINEIFCSVVSAYVKLWLSVGWYSRCVAAGSDQLVHPAVRRTGRRNRWGVGVTGPDRWITLLIDAGLCAHISAAAAVLTQVCCTVIYDQRKRAPAALS